MRELDPEARNHIVWIADVLREGIDDAESEAEREETVRNMLPEALVVDAIDPDSPLHPYFKQNDDEDYLIESENQMIASEYVKSVFNISNQGL